MISCDKCGFGHRTFEELKACKSWSEMVAEEKMADAAKDKVCAEIQDIMRVYREQDASRDGVGTPGGWSTWETCGVYCGSGTRC
jgi:hypothetical protein